jgi:predicted secreted protein
MTVTGSLIAYICIWWIVFFSILPIGIESKKNHTRSLYGNDTGAPKNPKIVKKFIFSTLITTILFLGIYYMVSKDYLNIRELLQ